MFGLEPNFGCCTANFNQAWPKFALSAVALSADGLAVMSPVPVSVRIEKEGTAVSLQVISGYPFRDEAVIEITAERPVEMELLVRIPGFAQGALVDGEKAEPGSFYRIYRKWEEYPGEGEFSFVPVLTDRPNDMKAMVRGPLVFSLPITETCRKLEYVKDGVERKAPYCDYELTPASDWNYGFCTETFEVRGNEIGEFPFAVDNPPLQIKTEMVKIPLAGKWRSLRPSAAGAQGIIAAGGKASAALWMHQSAYDGDAPGQPVRRNRRFRLSGRTGDRAFCNYTAIRLKKRKRYWPRSEQ